jgi:tape measure domain-containing protein
MLEVAKLVAVYDADTRGFDQKSEDVQNTLEKLSSGAGSIFGGFVGAQIFMQAVNALGRLTAEGVQTYASFERLNMSLQSLAAREAMSSGAARNMGQALAMSSEKAGELVNWIQRLAVKSPFTREGVSAAFRQAMAYGFAADEAQRLTQAMIDFAAGSGASEGAMSQIALALGQIQARGRLAGQEVLQLVNAGIPVQQILAKAFGKSTAEIAKMIESGLIPANAAIEAIVQSLEHDFGGAAERQAETITGLISSLSDLRDINLTAFFGGFFEKVQPYLAEFVDALSDPVMQENLAELGKSAGELVVTLAEGGKEILSVWSSIPEPLRSAAIALIGIEAATPPLIDMLGRGAIALNNWGSVLKSLPGFYRDVQAAQVLLKEGENVFDVMSTGAAGLTAALGPLAMALAAVTAVAVTYNETVGKVQREGIAASAEAWSDVMEKVREQGGGARAVLDAYAEGVANVNAAHEAGGLAADLFIDKQKIIHDGLTAALDGLSESANSWEEYNAAALEAARIAGYQVDEQGRLYTMMWYGSGLVRKYADDLSIMTRGQWAAADAIRKGGDTLDHWERKARNAGKAAVVLKESTVNVSEILNTLQSALKVENMSRAAEVYEEIAVSLGVIPDAAQQASRDVQMLSTAFAMGLINQAQYVEYMKQAQEGALNLNTAARDSIQGMIDNAAAAREAAQAAASAAQEYWGLAESLKGASEAQFAKQMLEQLSGLLKGDRPNVELYNKAYQELALQYGFVSEKSMALAGAIPVLTKALEEGKIAPEQLSEAMGYLFRDAADGTVQWEEFSKKFMTAPAVLAQAQSAIEQTGKSMIDFGTDVTAASTVVDTEFPKWIESAKAASEAIAKAFTDQDWVGLGLAVSQGVADGLQKGKSAISKAAESAAKSAYQTAAATLGIQSPSRVFRDEIARNMMAGWIQGIEAMQPKLQTAITVTANAAAGTAERGIQQKQSGVVLRNYGTLIVQQDNPFGTSILSALR